MLIEMPKLVLAAVQAAPMLFDADETLRRFDAWLSRAAETGADLIVFPEAFLGGYPKGVDFGVRVGSRDGPGRELYRRYVESAFDPSGPRFARVRELVARTGAHVVTGLIEPAGGTLHCATATIGPDGELLALHRKLMPTAMERVIWGQGGAEHLGAARTPIGTIGAAICWENYMPLYRQYLYEQGTSLYCAPTVDDREVWLPTMRMIALEGRCFVVSACQFMTRADVRPDVRYSAIQGDTPSTVLIRGGSCIVSPLGEVLASPMFGEVGLVHATVDTDDRIRGQFDLDNAGHYTRPDVFRLTVRQD